MAVYHIGEILRMKREALGFSREKLCELSEEACSPQTIYRIESGKVKVNQKTYRKLMHCMGENTERNYGSILVSDYRDLNIKSEIQGHLFRREFEKAEEKLKELEQKIDGNYVRNKQYLLKTKNYIKYYKGQISAQEYLDKLWQALYYTIPKLKQTELKQWAYNSEEFEILFCILAVYEKNGFERKEVEEFLLQLKENSEKKYVEENYYVSRHIQCLVTLSQLMCLSNQYEQSLEYCKEGMKEAKEQRLSGIVYCLLYDFVWNTEQKIKQGLLPKEERAFCKKTLVQAYYISLSNNLPQSAERIKRLCERLYQDEIILY